MTTPPTAQPTPLHADVVVVGAGPAGLFQLFQLGLQGLSCHAIDALPHPGGQCAELYPHKPIYDIPAVPACNGAELVERLQAQLAPFPITWHWGQTVQAIDAANSAGTGADTDGLLQVQTEAGLRLHCRAVVLALGVGAFVPRRPKLDGLDTLLDAGRQVFLQSHDRHAALGGLRVVVHGGDEAAVERALQLAALPADQRPASIALLHRRDVFKAAPAQLQQLQTLRETDALQVVIGQPEALLTEACANGTPQLRALQLQDADGQSQTLALDTLLVYQGIAPRLGALADWGLALQTKQVVVDPATMGTSRTGIHAIGDIASYAGKRKLIASAFHEGIVAAFAIAERLRQKPLQTLYTTTSTLLLERLGRQPD